MKLRQLDALRAVAEAGSLHDAARRLCVTQPAISRSIKDLEVELGVQLLTRSASGAVLTAFAQQVLQRVLVVQREVGRIVEDAQTERGDLGGQLTIAVTPPASTRALADAIVGLITARPSVKVQVIESRAENIADGLRNGTIDVGVFTRYGEPKNASFEWTRLYDLDVVLTIPASYRGATRLRVEQIHALPWLLLDSPDDESGFVATLFNAHGMPLPERITRVSAMNLYLDLATRIEAVGVWSSLALPLLAQYASQGTVKLLTLVEPMPRIGVYLAYSSENLLTTTAREFVRRLHANLDRGEDARRPAGFVFTAPISQGPG